MSTILSTIKIYQSVSTRSFLLIVLFLASFSLKSQDSLKSDPIKKRVIFFDKITKRRNFLVAPQFDRSPETGILTGIYYLQLFKHKGDTTSRTSNTETFLSVTEKKQFLFEFNETILFKNYILRGNNIFTRYNEYFYGIGNNIDLKQRDRIQFNFFQSSQRLTRKIVQHVFAGLQYQYYQVYNLSYEENSILEKSGANGIKGSRTSGLGPVLLYDSRDNVIYSRTGFYIDLSASFVTKFLGSNYQFTNVTFDARKFIPVYKNNIVCIQGLVNYNVGDVPFRQLALMGSDIMMRGYYMGSYRDKVMTCGQVELRVPVWRFIGITLFTAVGQVQPNFTAFNWSDTKYTYGMGLRLMFIKHERVNVGGDIGFGKNTKALYLGSGESF